MSRKTNCAAVLLLVLSGGLTVWASQGPEEEITVSVANVIANPGKFDGRRLRVIGVLGYGGGTDRAVCLYVSKPDPRNGVRPNCIYIAQSLDRGDTRIGQYVILNATFHYVTGHGVKYLSFRQVSDIKLWSSPPEK